MTECEEVAATMLPGYLAHREECWKRGRMAGRPCDYVMCQLRATESYVVIDNVSAALDRLFYDWLKKSESESKLSRESKSKSDSESKSN